MADPSQLPDDTSSSSDDDISSALAQLQALSGKYRTQSSMNFPLAQEAYSQLTKSASSARQTLQEARQRILSEKYNSAIPLLTASAALGQPTRAGSFAESFGNMSGALADQLQNKAQSERQQAMDLLGVDTKLSDVDERTGLAGLKLAQIEARMKSGMDLPSSYREWVLYNQLSPAQQRAYLEMKRNPNLVVKDVNEIPTIINPSHILHPDLPAEQPLSTQQSEAGAKQQMQESKTVGKGFGEQYDKIQTSGFNANSKITNLQRMQQFLQGMSTGTFTPAKTEVAKIAQGLGIDIDPTLGAKQALAALASEVALQMRNPAGGAGMPGSLSDKDLAFLRSMPPGIEKTPEGNRLLTETSMKLAQRDKDVAALARTYRKAHGQLDEGFFDQLDEWSKQHPLFSEGKTSSPLSDADLLKKWNK